jgi:hypothetical protein
MGWNTTFAIGLVLEPELAQTCDNPITARISIAVPRKILVMPKTRIGSEDQNRIRRPESDPKTRIGSEDQKDGQMGVLGKSVSLINKMIDCSIIVGESTLDEIQKVE